jgi:hypothetical protein
MLPKAHDPARCSRDCVPRAASGTRNSVLVRSSPPTGGPRRAPALGVPQGYDPAV